MLGHSPKQAALLMDAPFNSFITLLQYQTVPLTIGCLFLQPYRHTK